MSRNCGSFECGGLKAEGEQGSYSYHPVPSSSAPQRSDFGGSEETMNLGKMGREVRTGGEPGPILAGCLLLKVHIFIFLLSSFLLPA